MKITNLKNFINGWFIGDFNPTLVRTKNFEVCLKEHKKNEQTFPHLHTSSTEFNLIVSGRTLVNGHRLKKGDLFVYEKNEVSNVVFLTNTLLLIIRIPSAPNDKVLVDV